MFVSHMSLTSLGMIMKTTLLFRSLSLMLFAGISITLCSCGSSNPALTGTVKFDGELVDNGTIIFIPKGGSGPKVGTFINEQGIYEVEPAKGLVSGDTYKVEIRWNKKTGKQIMSNDPPNKEDETIQVIPEKYNKNSNLEYTVQSGEQTKDFELAK